MGVELSDIRERLARIETIQKFQTGVLEKIDGKLDGVDNRLAIVETKAAGYGTVAGGVMALAVSLISAKLTGKA